MRGRAGGRATASAVVREGKGRKDVLVCDLLSAHDHQPIPDDGTQMRIPPPRSCLALLLCTDLQVRPYLRRRIEHPTISQHTRAAAAVAIIITSLSHPAEKDKFAVPTVERMKVPFQRPPSPLLDPAPDEGAEVEDVERARDAS